MRAWMKYDSMGMDSCANPRIAVETAVATAGARAAAMEVAMEVAMAVSMAVAMAIAIAVAVAVEVATTQVVYNKWQQQSKHSYPRLPEHKHAAIKLKGSTTQTMPTLADNHRICKYKILSNLRIK